MNPTFQTPTTSTKATDFVVIIVVLVVVVFSIIIFKRIFGGIDGVLEGVGLKDTKDEKKDKAEVENKVDNAAAQGVNSPWSPKFYKTVHNGKLFTVASADGLAKTIYDSVGHIYDEPNKGAGAIKQCYTKTQVSFLADRFQQKYGNDLLSWLQYHYDTGEQKKVLNNILTYVNNLPLAQPK